MVDAGLLAPVLKAPVADLPVEVLADLVVVDHCADPQADLRCALESTGGHAGADRCQQLLGRDQQRLPPASSLGRQARVAAGHQPLARIVRVLDDLEQADSERAAAAAQRASPMEPAEVSPAAKAKAASKRTPEGLPVQSLRTLLEHLGALALNYVTLAQDDQHEFLLVAQPTALQAKAFALLDVDSHKVVSSKMTS